MDGPRDREELYRAYLSEINDIKFTNREVDVIACIVHNRSNKKIASLLSISYRTVENHIYNINSRIGKSSKDDIIDFIEKSGKLSYIRQYYSCVLLDDLFNNALLNIAKNVNKNPITYNTITYNIRGTNFLNTNQQLNTIIDQKLRKLQRDLKIANVILNINSTEVVHYYLLESNDNKIKNTNKDIVLLFDDVIEHTEKKKVYIDFTTKQNYYFSVFDLLKQIISNPTYQIIENNFKVAYQNLFTTPNSINACDTIEFDKINSQKDYDGLDDDSNTTWNNTDAIDDENILRHKYNRRLIGIAAIFKTTKLVYYIIPFIICTASFAWYHGTSRQTSMDVLLIQELQQLISQGLTASYIKQENIDTNYNLIKKANRLFEQISLSKISSYITTLSSNELCVLLYNIHALSNYILYNEFDGVKARLLLTYAKTAIESYVNTSSKIKLDFESLTPKEIYTELSIITDLPEIYTRVIYLLGRTYIYNGDIQKAEKYFTLSQYLGNKLGLFEGYLSVISGLLIIEDKEINKDIDAGNYLQARKKINETIKTYQIYKNDTKEYKDNYQSKNKYDVIVPKNSPYNQVGCSKQIIKLAGYLMDLQLILDELKSGLLLHCTYVPDRKVAALYNAIGGVLLKAYDSNTDFSPIQSIISKELSINSDNSLEFLYQLFNFTNEKSRSTEFTKADSYNGLIEVSKRKITINQDNNQKEELKELINSLITKRDYINGILNRSMNEK